MNTTTDTIFKGCTANQFSELLSLKRIAEALEKSDLIELLLLERKSSMLLKDCIGTLILGEPIDVNSKQEQSGSEAFKSK